MRKVSWILSIVGLLLMGYAAYEVVSGKVYQAWRGRELDRALDRLPPAPAAHRRPSYEPGSAIGRLEIRRLGLSVVVLEGSDDDSLRLGVGRLRNSALPSEPGNVVLAGHRDTFFRSLRDIRKGDRISLRTTDGTFPYTVDWTTVVNPKDTGVIMPTASPALTLVTCYPFYYIGSAPQRFIVRAIPADSPINAAAPSAPHRPSPFDTPAKAVQPAAAPKPAVVADVAATPVDAAPADAPDIERQPHRGPLKRAFGKIAGVFSSHGDKVH
ncbi:MAG: class D sortase [Ignavibacteriota bacterium]